MLSTLNGLESLSNIPGKLTILSNNVITALSGLDNLASIGGELKIENNVSLSTLTGLESLISIGECLTIKGNTMLNNLAGINNLTSIGSCFDPGEGRSANRFNNVAITIGGLYEYEGNGNLYDFCSLSSLVASVEVSENALVIGQNLYNPTYTQIQDGNACANAALSVNEESINKINIYPNPVSDNLYIDFSGNSNLNKINLEIYDVTGKLVTSYSNIQQLTINLRTLSKGVYFYLLKDENSIIKNGKLIKN